MVQHLADGSCRLTTGIVVMMFCRWILLALGLLALPAILIAQEPSPQAVSSTAPASAPTATPSSSQIPSDIPYADILTGNPYNDLDRVKARLAAATQPAVVPPTVSSQRQTELQTLLAQLADPDSQVRIDARFALLKINLDELNAFLAIAKNTGPLQPAQTQVIRGIFVHVSLAHEQYDGEKTTGMVGARGVDSPAAMTNRKSGELPSPADGPMISALVPGFCGYENLQVGDILVSMEDPHIPIRLFADLAQVVRARKPGDKLRLNILRQGMPVSVDLVLNARPAAATSQELDQLFTFRETLVDAMFNLDWPTLSDKYSNWDPPHDSRENAIPLPVNPAQR